jgi:hypothetical protein
MKYSIQVLQDKQHEVQYTVLKDKQHEVQYTGVIR